MSAADAIGALPRALGTTTVLADSLWSQLSLIFFFGLFVLICVWLLTTRASYWRANARIPLEDAPVHDRNAPDTNDHDSSDDHDATDSGPAHRTVFEDNINY